MMQPTTIEELQSIVRGRPRLLPRGGGSKPALSTPVEGVASLDMAALAGVVEYEPGEFTFTALAGTRVSDVVSMLDQHSQYLPFDPLLVERGATLGGTVASGLSGPGRYRYGGVRDFLLGVRYADGEGRIVRSGGKVVKNAAGFDLPKLMVGSLGRLGVLVELSFKVFPRPETYLSLRLECAALDAAVESIYRLYGSQLDIDALDLVVDATQATLWARLGGLADALAVRVDRLRGLLGGGDVIAGDAEARFWRDACELAWLPAGWSLIKVPLTPRRIVDLEQQLAGGSSVRRYSGGGQLVWVATPEPPSRLDALLTSLGLSGLLVFGPPGSPRLGARTGDAFARRVKAALDPAGRFAEV